MTWQPIHTAPRDGTEILASDYDAIDIVATSWRGVQHGTQWFTRAGEPFWPSWWQPLPDHPPLPEEAP